MVTHGSQRVNYSDAVYGTTVVKTLIFVSLVELGAVYEIFKQDKEIRRGYEVSFIIRLVQNRCLGCVCVCYFQYHVFCRHTIRAHQLII